MTTVFNVVDPGPIAGVEIGIPVVDVDGTPLGVVEYLDMSGSGRNHYGRSPALPAAGWMRDLAAALTGDNVMEPHRARAAADTSGTDWLHQAGRFARGCCITSATFAPTASRGYARAGSSLRCTPRTSPTRISAPRAVAAHQA